MEGEKKPKLPPLQLPLLPNMPEANGRTLEASGLMPRNRKEKKGKKRKGKKRKENIEIGG